jgi:serine phosphatase RsbU (regulator of sigma subunit)
VTIDLAEIHLDSGKVEMYKWGAVPSYVVGTVGVEKIGTAGPPPGLSVTDYRESRERLSLRKGQMLIMVSDGVGEAEALRCCMAGAGKTPAEIAVSLLTAGRAGGQDDATVVAVSLETAV